MIKSDKITGLLIFSFSFLFYIATLAPTVLWGDSAKLALYAYNRYLLLNPTGGHPLHTLFGMIFSFIPIGDFAYRQNMMSAFFGSMTVVFLFFIIRNMGIRRWVCVLAAFSFALSHTWWLVSVVNESYTLNVFFIAVSLFIISIFERSTRKTILICAGSFVAGLSLTDSLLFLFLVPGVLYFFLSGKHKTFALKRSYIGILFFLLGNSLWGYEYIKNMIFLQHKTSLGFINMITYASMRYVKPALFIKNSFNFFVFFNYHNF